MADSDVKLLDGQVKVEAWDLCLDSKDRRKNDTPYRRALVHDYGDRLTLNWGKDYPEGVQIQGKTVVDGELSVTGDTTINGTVKINGPLYGKLAIVEAGYHGQGVAFKANSLFLKGLDPNQKGGEALSHIGNALVINAGENFEGGVQIKGNVSVSGYFSSGKAFFSEIQFGLDNPFTPAHEQYITINSSSITVHNVKRDSATGSGSTGGLSSTELDLVKEVLRMRDEINELNRKVRALELA